MNEYTIAARGCYKEIEWHVRESNRGTGWMPNSQFTGHVSAFFTIGDKWLDMDKVEMCVKTEYDDYVVADAETLNEAKERVARLIDYLVKVPISDRQPTQLSRINDFKRWIQTIKKPV